MKKGFTLIELMIVIAILGIFISIAATFFVGAVDTDKIPRPAIEQKHDPSVPVEEKKLL